MNGRSLAVTLWRQRWAALIVLVLVLAAAAAWLAFAPRKYTATAMIGAMPEQNRPQASTEALETTLARLANSRPVLMDVHDRVGKRRTTAELQHEVRGQRVGGTVLIRITVADSDRVYARDVANAVADVLPLHDPSGGLFRFTDAGRATTPTSFSSPDTEVVVLWGIGSGILLALATALVREVALGRVDDRAQLAELAGTPVLGSIARPSDPSKITADSPGSVADQFRSLRVALEFASSDEPTHTVVLAPLSDDRATAWVAVNLASALAQVQRRVLVIDADFGTRPRHPALTRKGPGLADVLRGRAELCNVVRPSEIPGVSILPVGNADGTPPANLVEVGFHDVLRELQERVDVVLVHAAPLTESDDARVMAVGNTLLITVTSGRVRAKVLRNLLADIRRMRLRVLGTVLLGSRRQ